MPSLRRRLSFAASTWVFWVIIILWSLFILALPLFLFSLLLHFHKPYLYIAYILFVFLATYLVFTEKVTRGTTSGTTTSPATQTVDVEMRVFNYVANGNTEQEQCVICLTDYGEAQLPALSLPTCQHNFHVECIEEWLRRHNRCPICSAPAFPTHAAQSSPPRVVRVSVANDN